MLSISATARLGPVDILVAGCYSQNFSYLEAEVGNLTVSDLAAIYQQLSGKPMSIDVPEDIKMDQMYLQISTDGVILSGRVSVQGQSSAAATLTFSALGVQISGSVADVYIPETDILVENAGLDILIGPKGSKSRVALKGSVNFGGLNVAVGFVLGEAWMVYGRVSSVMPLAKLCPVLEGTFLGDVRLLDVALLASNGSAGECADMNVNGYPISKGTSPSYHICLGGHHCDMKLIAMPGIRLCARIDKLEQVDKLSQRGKATPRTARGMVLIASYDPANELQLAIQLQDVTFDLSDSVKFGNIGIAVVISKDPRLKFSGDLTISIKDQQPLVLTGALYATVKSVGGYIETKTTWKNPFGVSKEVEIRQLAADVAFSYITGLEKVAVAGAIMVGDTEGRAAFAAGAAADQMVSVALDNLRATELVHFTGRAFEINVLQNLTALDFLVFESAGLYFSTGTRIGSQHYPAGVSAHGTVKLFGKLSHFEATANAGGLALERTVQNFAVGPLEVCSASGAPCASLDVQLTKTHQQFKIDGMVKLWDVELVMLMNVSASPPIAFFVWIYVDFGGIVTLDLLAEATNISATEDLSKADLSFSTEIKGDPLAKICEAVLNLLDTVQEFGTETLDAVNAHLRKQIASTAERREAIAGILEEARRNLDQRRCQRQAHINEQQKIRDEAEAELEQLRKKVREAKDAKAAAVEAARREVETAEQQKAELIERKRAEYQEELQKAQKRQQELADQERELKHKRLTLYGKLQQDVAAALKDYKEHDGGLTPSPLHGALILEPTDFSSRHSYCPSR